MSNHPPMTASSSGVPLSEREAKQVPLVELLGRVPLTARLVIEDGPYSTSYIPVGRYCHEAAAALQSPAGQASADGARSAEAGGEAAHKALFGLLDAIHAGRFVPNASESEGYCGSLVEAGEAALASTPTSKGPA